MDFFGMTLEAWQFWLIIAVLIVVVLLVIAIPIYKGYKVEMERQAKLEAKKKAAAKKKTTKKSTR